jgi:hypothetical protein
MYDGGHSSHSYGAVDADASSLHFGFVRSDGQGLLDEFTLRKK